MARKRLPKDPLPALSSSEEEGEESGTEEEEEEHQNVTVSARKGTSEQQNDDEDSSEDDEDKEDDDDNNDEEETQNPSQPLSKPSLSGFSSKPIPPKRKAGRKLEMLKEKDVDDKKGKRVAGSGGLGSQHRLGLIIEEAKGEMSGKKGKRSLNEGEASSSKRKRGGRKENRAAADEELLSGEEDAVASEEEGIEDLWKKYPYLCSSMDNPNFPEGVKNITMKRMGMVREHKLVELDGEWRTFMEVRWELFLKELNLIGEQMKLCLDDMKSQDSQG